MPYPLPIKERYLLPYYETQEQYTEKTGKPCPAFVPDWPIQNWEAPEVAPEEDLGIYENQAVACRPDGSVIPGADGKPFLRRLIVPSERATRVNIPPPGNQPEGVGLRITQPPIGPLQAGEYLDWQPMGGGLVCVQNLLEQPEPQGFTASDRAMLVEVHGWMKKLIEDYRKETGR